MKKSVVVVLMIVGLSLSAAPVAGAANGVPDVTGKSISDARNAIRSTGDRMTLTLISPINGCKREDRRADSQSEVYFRATDRSVVNVRFACP